MKKVISTIISITMVLSMIPCTAHGESIKGVSKFSMGETMADIEFKEVTEQDVEVYVTDGYEAISGAEVQLNNETKTTDEYGKVLFEAVPVQEELYDIVTSTHEFGEKTTSVQISEKIPTDEESKIALTVSYISLNSQNQPQAISENDDISVYNVSRSLGTLNQWVKGADMPEERIRNSSVEYRGKLYVGGTDSEDHFLIYDIKNNSWKLSASNENKARGFNINLYYGKIYNIAWSGEVEIYDIESDTWATGTQATDLHNVDTTVMHNNKIYVLDGTARSSSSVYCVYDIETDAWSSIASPPRRFSPGKVIASNNKIYVMGGSITSSPNVYQSIDSLYIYDIETNTWSQGASMVYARCLFTPILYNQKIYAAGGAELHDGRFTEDISAVEVYDIATDTWTTVSTMPNPRCSYGAVLYKDDIYYIGGETEFPNTNSYTTVNKYNITSNTWEDVSNLFGKRAQFDSIVYNGKIYVTGGNHAYLEDRKGLEIYTIEDLPDITEGENSVYTIVSAERNNIEVEYNTPVEAFDAQLPTQVMVYLNNGSNIILPITGWDKSEYIADAPGEYMVYGTIDLPDGIINPYDKKAEVTVKVPDPPTHDITEIPPIQIMADQSIPLEREGLEHAFGEPVTVPVPETVEAKLDNGEIVELNVTWDIDSYNSHIITDKPQIIFGTVELRDGIENPKGLPAELDITVMPAEYWIMDLNPQTISIDVLAGTTKEEILEKIEPKNIDVDVMNAETGDEIYIYTGFTFSDEYTENTSYNPNQLGKQTLIGRFYDNFLDETTVPPCVEVEVNVVSSEIASVPEKHINAYQCAAFEQIENLPQKVTVILENGMTAEVDVDWNSGNYERGIAGDQIITGELINLPAGVIQPEEEKTATLIVHVLPVNYEITAVTPDEDYFETDKDGNTLYAGFTLSELRGKLPVDEVKVELESVTEGIEFTTDYELDFTLEEENNSAYVPEEEYFDYLYGTLVLPDNISNPNNMLYEFTVYTSPVEIEEIEPVSVIVEYYTEFNDIDLPDTVYANLSNGQRKPIGVEWKSDGYNPVPDELTEDNPVVFNLSGTLRDVPLYINHYDKDVPQLTITLVLPRVYKITDISPVRIPETGTKKINLGSSIKDIYDIIENHTATVTLENLKGVTSTQDLTFTLREEDNEHYDAMSEEEVELTAYLNLPEGIENPDNKQLVISVRPTKYTIKTAVVSKVNGILAGTLFEEIAMPDKVIVNYTDTEVKQGEVPVASWDGSKYNPNKIGNQPIKGTFLDPLPVYVTNPNNRTPSALINVIDPSTTILSAKQITEEIPFSAMKRSIRKAEIQTEEIEGYIERKYEVELLHKDGSISKEIVSIFNEITE